MKTVLVFILNHLEMIVSILLVIISLLITLFKKKPTLNEFDNILVKVLLKLPDFINSAEFLNGAELKKSMVMKAVSKYVKDEFSINLPQSCLDFISARVEEILSTPQKH